MAAVTSSAIALGALEAIALIMKQFPTYDQRRRREFEADYEIYKIQQTIPHDHPDRNDSLFLRVRHRLLKHVKEFSAFVDSNGKAAKSLPPL